MSHQYLQLKMPHRMLLGALKPPRRLSLTRHSHTNPTGRNTPTENVFCVSRERDMHNSKVGTTECPAHSERKTMSGTFLTTVMKHNEHHTVFKAHLGPDRHEPGSVLSCRHSGKCQRRAHGLLGTKRFVFFYEFTELYKLRLSPISISMHTQINLEKRSSSPFSE